MQPPSRWTRRACGSAILIEPRADLPQAITLGVDKAYDDRGFRQRVALDEGDAACGAEYGQGSSAIDGRTTRYSPPPADCQGRHLRSPTSRYLFALTISGRQSAPFFNVPLGIKMSWQRGCRVCCI
jgi:hypothetical protein